MKETNSPFQLRLSKTEPKQTKTKNDHDSTKSDCKSSEDTGEEATTNKQIERKQDYATYKQTKLILSGDVETEPGPTKIHIPITKLIIILITVSTLILLTGISLYNIEATEHIPGPYTIPTQLKTHVKQNLLSISNLLILSTKKKHIKISSRAAYLVIILLTAGDIQPHPGPYNQRCLVCKQPENNSQTHDCDTCRGWCHISCNNQINNPVNLMKSSYQWHCPNPKCLPNHHGPLESTLQQTPNRYSPLNLANSNKQRTYRRKIKTNQPKMQKSKIRDDTENLLRHPPKIKSEDYLKRKNKKEKKIEVIKEDNLWNVLPKISAKDYEGKESCKACHRPITNKRAISCDSCCQWTHLKCSDMSVKVYNTNKNKEFPWTCNTCREPEHMEYTDIKKLKPEELPASNEEITVSDAELLILHYNCRSLINKSDEVERICIQLKPDVLCLTETWLDSSTPQTAYIPEGYRIIRNDRSDEFKQRYGKTSGGGTSILYKKHLKIKSLNIGEKNQETQWIQIKTKQTLTIGLVYRAEYTDLLEDKDDSPPLEALLNEASIKSCKIIVLGDFNCDVSALKKCPKTNTLEQIFGRLSMQQLIKKPTRISTSNKATIIDHVWTNPALKLVNEAGTIEGFSDHVGQYIKVNQKLEKPEPEMIKFRSYRAYNKDNFNEDLKMNLINSEFDNEVNNNDVNKAMDTWIKVFSDTAQKHAPIIEKMKKATTRCIPWSTKLYDMKITERNNKLKLYRLYGNKRDLEAANNITNVITHLKRKLKKQHYKEKIEKYEGDPRNLWKMLKDITQTTPDKNTAEPEFMNQSKANQFNKFFATVGTVIQRSLGTKETTSTISTRGTFTFKEETEETIRSLIDRIRIDVTTGEDDISARLLKDAKFTIAASITKLVSLSYSQKIFPDAMKRAIIRPIHKKNCTEDISNYRPISILSVISKIFERSATNQLVKYLEDHGLLNPTQHAYRKGHSTQTCLMEIVEYIQKQRDNRKTIGLASLDLSKAFDSISHSHLLVKLGKLGLHGDAINWCKSYLENRKQKTKFKKYTSEEHLVTSGVPQGSILGPIMFICFTNDMATIFPNCKVLSYADDSQLIVTGSNKKEVKAQLQELIKIAQTWYSGNSLKNNASKTEIIIIGENKKEKKIPAYIEVTDDGKTTKLSPSKYVKILGIYIDDELNWNRQIQEVRKKACNSIRNLHRVNQLIPLKHRILLYNSLVASHYNYCDTVWSGCGVMNERKLQTTQNFAARSILGKSKHSSATEALTTLKFLPLKEKRTIHEAVYTHKAFRCKLPLEVTEQYKNLEPKKNLRSSKCKTLNIPKHATEQYKRGPLYRTVKTWNSIPAQLRTENITTTTFKKKYQTHLIECCKP